MTFSVSKLTGNEFELKILHSFSLRHGSTDWTWAEEFDIGITCGPLSQDVVDELERLYENNRQWTNNISPRIIRAEEELKALLSEKDAMDLYEGPPNNDLSCETPNKRKARRFRIKINMTDRDEGREKERLSKKRLMKNVDTGSFDYKILRRQGGVKVNFDYIIFKQSSMEWGDPLHFIAWKSICERRQRRSMTDEEILSTPQAQKWERDCAEHSSATKIQAVWRSFQTQHSKMPMVRN